jgi:hypothetical protein
MSSFALELVPSSTGSLMTSLFSLSAPTAMTHCDCHAANIDIMLDERADHLLVLMTMRNMTPVFVYGNQSTVAAQRNMNDILLFSREL